MDDNDVYTLIRAELSRLLGADKRFGDHDLLADHGLDSLRSVELTLNLEDIFSIAFEDDELAFHNFKSVSTITKLVASKAEPMLPMHDGAEGPLP